MNSWYWRSQSLQQRTGSTIFAKLFLQNGENAIATLLESPYPSSKENPQLSRYSICAGKPRIINGKPRIWTPKIGEILPFLRSLLVNSKREDNTNAPTNLPFIGGWLGWLGYDLAWEIEKLPPRKQDVLPFPVAYWYEPESFAILDHQEQILWLASTAPQQLDSLESQLESSSGEVYKEKKTNSQGTKIYKNIKTPQIKFLSDQEDYENAVRQAKKYIQAGDIFQANLSLRFQAQININSWEIYQTLQKINPSPFASYWQTPWGSLISCSPERLVKVESDVIETRPIAGTRSRGVNPTQDKQLAQELLDNVKERAEHIMLVDLERNDLGKVCQWGSIKVNQLLKIERYSHVTHLVSNIIGQKKEDIDVVEVIKAFFPGGTITGCPKVRCMEIIEELEPVNRSLFYGSCGYLDQRGNLDLNILIRTLLYSNQSSYPIVSGQVGAGIVADSDPEKEWYESLHKAEAQLTTLKLLITKNIN